MASLPRFRSLRWQLPVSYAAIALLAVLALGIALLSALTRFYREQELIYLTDNATVIATEIEPLLGEVDDVDLQSQLAGFSFLTQTRIQVWDEAKQTLLVDSGELGSFTPEIAVGPGGGGIFDVLGTQQDHDVIIVVEEELQSDGNGFSSERVITRTSTLPAQGSLYGFNLGVDPTTVSERSDLAVDAPIISEAGDVIGWVRLSEGPAYGRAIVRSVAWGWAAAGLVAGLLAALAGWLISRRLTRPLLALTKVTGQMAEGDLKARADVRRTDELGTLGQSFNQMANQVEGQILALRRFVADAAHELHTPLTALQTDLQLLDAGVDLAQQQRVARAKEQAQRLQALTDSLLALSRLEAEAVPEEQPLFDLARLVQVTGELYASQAEQADLAFEMQLPDGPLPVRGDTSQIQQVLVNVLDNSIKFTPAPGTVELSLAKEGEAIVITVRDTGVGIPNEDVPQLFSRFHRGRNTAGYAGSGLGLAIVQETMRRHGGQVSVESGEWRTVVRLVLPGDGVIPESLLADVSDANLHREISTGSGVGNEHW